MTHLIHFCNPMGMWYYNHGPLMDAAEQACSRGEAVKILVCDGTAGICPANLLGSKLFCAWCRGYRKRFFRRMRKDIDVLYYADFYPPESRKIVESLNFDYDSVEKIKELTYKNVKIGYGAFSTYVSKTRNLHPAINNEFKDYFNRCLRAGCVAAEILCNVFSETRPDAVHLFNGRHFDNRPFFDISTSMGVTVITYENVRRDRKKHTFSYMTFENALPHNIKYLCGLINRVWDGAELPEERKCLTGESFFENRKASLYAGDKIYTADQEYGTLPGGFDMSKRNIAVFTSSEDEFAAIGDEYDGDQVLGSQQRAIEEILEHFKSDANVRFYIRVHPNLQKVKYRYHASLIELGRRYANAVVIKADDAISSYSLLENVEKTIVFGSTIGLEACYWGKPVILLCASFYDYLDVGYKPKTADEAFSMIADDGLPPKDRAGALRYGFYVMYDRHENSKPMKFPDTWYKFWRELFRILIQVRVIGRLTIPLKEAKA